MIDKVLYRLTWFMVKTRLRTNNRVLARVCQEIAIIFLDLYNISFFKELGLMLQPKNPWSK